MNPHLRVKPLRTRLRILAAAVARVTAAVVVAGLLVAVSVWAFGVVTVGGGF
ncbi:hypothetical protein [Occultella kanbiaonis]|uniref:hypothetical protein n=1 Tax=Occultella kanbiaonis TaxID=2675754 RepID=UPI0013D4B139|nr:hypothetical protein [Occultella kanbiaonis]